MARELITTKRRRRTPVVEMVWYDGDNAIEVARWLVDHGAQQVDVHLKAGQATLSIGAYRKDIPEGHDGVWMEPSGNVRRRDEVSSQYDEVTE